MVRIDFETRTARTACDFGIIGHVRVLADVSIFDRNRCATLRQSGAHKKVINLLTATVVHRRKPPLGGDAIGYIDECLGIGAAQKP